MTARFQDCERAEKLLDVLEIQAGSGAGEGVVEEVLLSKDMELHFVKSGV